MDLQKWGLMYIWLVLVQWYIQNFEKLGVTVHHDIREAVANADVVNVLRIQLERISFCIVSYK